MKNFIISLTLFISSLSYSAIENPSNIYGYWLNNESEILLIQLDNSFTRSDKFSVLAEGNLELNQANWLVCTEDGCGRKYPIRDDIPVMLIDEGDKWVGVSVSELPVPPPKD